MARSLITEPLNLFTGGQGAGKTLFAIEQADLLRNEAQPAAVYQVNIREPDTRYLPHLPFDVHEMAYKDGEPVRDEQGNHLPRWAVDLPKPCVIIVDEAHKVFPQRGPGRPQRSVEAMAESRYESVRWLLLTQAPGSLDAFLRDRMNVHWHIERKGGARGATMYQFDNRVVDKNQMSSQKRFADAKTVRRYPSKYFTWYKSAKSHHFRFRLPLKVWAALLFIPVAAVVAFRLFGAVGDMTSQALPGTGEAAAVGEGAERRAAVIDPAAYVAQFVPVIPSQPWSAPAFQGRELQAQPDIYCIASGVDMAEDCRCFTEQVTPIALDTQTCKFIARHGQYNPHRAPLNSGRNDGEEWADGKRDKPSYSAARVRPPGPEGAAPVAGFGDATVQQAAYGAFRQ